MTRTPPKVISLSSTDGRLVVEFQWQGDRFTHRVLCNDVVVAQSVEGDSQSPWPASPPIQQLSLETIDGKPTALGVGASGRSYWSFSAQFTPMPQGAQAIRFDVAARVPRTETLSGKTPSADSNGGEADLRSTYQLLNPRELRPRELRPIELRPIDGEPIVEPSSSPDWRCFAIRPHAVSTARGSSRVSAMSPITVCWSYLLGYQEQSNKIPQSP